MGIVEAAAVVGIAGTVAGGVGTALGSKQPGRVQLPTEMEAQELDIINTQVQQFENESIRTDATADAIFERGQILNDIQKGLIPTEEGLARITETNQLLADKFGEEILGQIGELSEDLGLESMIRERTETLISSPLEEFKDPTTERQIGEGRRVLEERLSRQLGADWRNSDSGIRALTAFEQSATELRSNASRNVRAEKLGLLTGATGIAGSIIGARTAAGSLMFEGRQSSISNLFAGMSPSGQSGLGFMGQGAQIGGKALEYGQFPMQSFQQFGSQAISGDTKKGMEDKYGFFNNQSNPFMS